MKAVILNSGKGERLHPLTADMPKALIKVGDKAILGHQLDNLVRCNISKVLITTGPFASQITDYVAQDYLELNSSYVHNPEYRTTNSIYSVWLTKGLIDDDIILLHGDLLFDRILLERLLDARHPNCVLVGRNKAPDKDFKALIENDRVVEIGTELSGSKALSLLPLYKFCRADFVVWLDEIEKFINRGDVGRYAEDAFSGVSGKIALSPLYFDDEVCMEIDTKEDLDKARKMFSGSL